MEANGDLLVPETNVLAIASHVTYGYVGNKMATFVMQALGCDVSAIDTVHFSNHTAYKQFKGRKVPAEEIQALWDGLKQSDLNHFDMLLTGYTATKDAVETLGTIGRDLRFRANMKPGSFFWILDPVMGDEGRLYVADEIVPAYKLLLRDADLILPNCFEAELLSDTKITDMDSVVAAITKLHQKYQIPHIIVTSLRLSKETGKRRNSNESDTLAVVGSTCRKDHTPRVFSITVPSLPIFFSGTGDMFAALTAVRLREAAIAATLLDTPSWQSPDDVPATELPLAKATEKTLASIHAVLTKTAGARERALKEGGEDGVDEDEGKRHLRRTRASEVRVVRFVGDLRRPKLEGVGVRFRAEAVRAKQRDVSDGGEITEGAAKVEEGSGHEEADESAETEGKVDVSTTSESVDDGGGGADQASHGEEKDKLGEEDTVAEDGSST